MCIIILGDKMLESLNEYISLVIIILLFLFVGRIFFKIIFNNFEIEKIEKVDIFTDYENFKD